MVNIAINGFGRIGRAAAKILMDKKDARLVAINDLTDAGTLAYLMQYDTSYGVWEKKVSADGDALVIGKTRVPVFAEKDPAKLPWRRLKVDVVLECTGAFTSRDAASAHLSAGAGHVIISAPAKGGSVPTVVLGVNGHELNDLKMQRAASPQGTGSIISNASCTTNCITPVAAVMHSAFGVKKATMTTIHAYTADQRLQDAPHDDLRRGRAAAENIVPTTTGAALTTTEVIPELSGIFDGLAIRVPVAVGSLADCTFLLSKNVTVEEVNTTFRAAAESERYRGILAVTDEPIVSSDIIGTSYSAIVDLSLTQVVDGDLVKVISWYDNEWAYSHRLVELALQLGAPAA